MREEVLNLMVSSIRSWHAYFGLEQKFSGGRSLFLSSIEQAYNYGKYSHCYHSKKYEKNNKIMKFF